MRAVRAVEIALWLIGIGLILRPMPIGKAALDQAQAPPLVISIGSPMVIESGVEDLLDAADAIVSADPFAGAHVRRFSASWPQAKPAPATPPALIGIVGPPWRALLSTDPARMPVLAGVGATVEGFTITHVADSYVDLRSDRGTVTIRINRKWNSDRH